MDKMRNVGTLDAYVRIAAGLAALTWVAAGKAGRCSGLVTLLGAMKVAEGITRFCPMLALLKTSTLEVVDHAEQTGSDVPVSRGDLPNPFAAE